MNEWTDSHSTPTSWTHINIRCRHDSTRIVCMRRLLPRITLPFILLLLLIASCTNHQLFRLISTSHNSAAAAPASLPSLSSFLTLVAAQTSPLIGGGIPTDISLKINTDEICSPAHSSPSFLLQDISVPTIFYILCASVSTGVSAGVFVWKGTRPSSYMITFPTSFNGTTIQSPTQLIQHPLTLDLYFSTYSPRSHKRDTGTDDGVQLTRGTGMFSFSPRRDRLIPTPINDTSTASISSSSSSSSSSSPAAPIPPPCTPSSILLVADIRVVPIDPRLCTSVQSRYNDAGIMFLPGTSLAYFICSSIKCSDRKALCGTMQVFDTQTNVTRLLNTTSSLSENAILSEITFSKDSSELLITSDVGIAIYNTTSDRLVWNAEQQQNRSRTSIDSFSSSSSSSSSLSYLSASISLLPINLTVCRTPREPIFDRASSILITFCNSPLFPYDIIGVWRIDGVSVGEEVKLTFHTLLIPTTTQGQFVNFVWNQRSQTLFVAASSGRDTVLAIQQILSSSSPSSSSSYQTTSLVDSSILCVVTYTIAIDWANWEGLWLLCQEGLVHSSGRSVASLVSTRTSSSQYSHASNPIYDYATDTLFLSFASSPFSQLKNRIITPLTNITFADDQRNRMILDQPRRSIVLCSVTGQILVVSRVNIDTMVQTPLFALQIDNLLENVDMILGTNGVYYLLTNQFAPYSVFYYNESQHALLSLNLQTQVGALIICGEWMVLLDELTISIVRVPMSDIHSAPELLWSDTTGSCATPPDMQCDESIGVVYFVCPLIMNTTLIRSDMSTGVTSQYYMPDSAPNDFCSYVGVDPYLHLVYIVCMNNILISTLTIFHDESRAFRSSLTLTKELMPTISGIFVDSYSSQVFVILVAGDNNALYSVSMLTSGFRCAEGSEWTQGGCQPCALGSFRGGPGSSIDTLQSIPRCSRCANGSIAQSTGTIECTQCQPGRFADRSLGEVCSICISGTYSNQSGSISCSPCDIGEFASSSESSSCSPCPAGQYSNMIGSPSCQVCQPGQYQSSNSSSSCQSCIPGRFANTVGAIECTNTTFGYYTNSYNASVALQCSSGRFSNTTTATFCYECDQGRYTSLFGASNCTASDAGSFVDDFAQPNQRQCPTGRFSNETGSTTCHICSKGSYSSDPGWTSCTGCQLGKYSQSGAADCSTCQIDTYTPQNGSSCFDCTNLDGLTCTNGLISVEKGWWPYLIPDPSSLGSLVYRATPCPPDYCEGGPLQFVDDVTNTSSTSPPSSSPQLPQLCEYPRLNSPDNWLCAECEQGFIAWGTSCQPCTGVNIGIVTGAFVFALILVYILMLKDPSASPLTILVFFLQISALELGSVWSWLDWIRFANFSSHSFRQCLAPITPVQQLILTLIIPFLLLALLGALCTVHYALSRCFHSGRTGPAVAPASSLSPTVPQVASSLPIHFRLLSHLRRLLQWTSKDFNRDRYIGAVTAILIFGYTPITVTVASSLHCVEIAPDRRRLFQTPTIDCDSSEYHQQLLPFIYIWLIMYVLGLPIFMFAFIWRRWHHVAQIVMSEESNDSSASVNGLVPSPSTHSSSSSSSFSRTQSIVNSFFAVQSWRAASDRPLTTPRKHQQQQQHQPSSNDDSSDIDDADESSQDEAKFVPLPRTPSVIAFNHRWGHLYRPYRLGAWFWQPIEMLQRFGFALISVLLVGQPSSRYAMYSTLSVVSLVLQIWCQPFSALGMNFICSLSYLLLSFISFTLSGVQQPPYSLGVQILFFMLIVPFVMSVFFIGARSGLADIKKFIEARRSGSHSSPTSSSSADHSISFTTAVDTPKHWTHEHAHPPHRNSMHQEERKSVSLRLLHEHRASLSQFEVPLLEHVRSS